MAFRWAVAIAAIVVALAVIECEARSTGTENFNLVEYIRPRPDNSSEPQPGRVFTIANLFRHHLLRHLYVVLRTARTRREER